MSTFLLESDALFSEVRTQKSEERENDPRGGYITPFDEEKLPGRDSTCPYSAGYGINYLQSLVRIFGARGTCGLSTVNLLLAKRL